MIFVLHLWIILLVLEASASFCSKKETKNVVHVMTKNQQHISFRLAHLKCTLEILNETAPIDGLYCNKTFANGICWPYTRAGEAADVPCPDYIHRFDPTGYARGHCLEDGTWKTHSVTNKTFTNFSECIQHSDSEPGKMRVSTFLKVHAYNIKVVYDIGYAISITSLALAIFLMLIFRKLHCPRNTVHTNLFFVFMLRAVICMVKDMNLVPEGAVVVNEGEITFNSTGSTWQCKLVYVLFHYLLTANYMWIFVEGLYLHTLIFFAMSNKKRLFKFLIIFGWVAPLPSVITWMLVRIYYADTLCWSTNDEGYYWIIKGPIILSIVVNFVFFLNIIRVLFTKLSAPNRSDPDRHRKLAKSTLVLIPLFGVYYIIFIAIPDCIDEKTDVVFLYIEISLSSFQGFFVALLFCFMNSEVRGEISKLWKRQLMRRQSTVSTKSNRTLSTGSSMFFRDKSTPGDMRSVHISDEPDTDSQPRCAQCQDNNIVQPEIKAQSNENFKYTKDSPNDEEVNIKLVGGLSPISGSDEDVSETSRML